MKQSFLFLALQVLSMIVGLFTTVYVAGNVDPVLYSLIVIYQVIISFYGFFTSLGYETILIRNALKWQVREKSKIVYFVSTSLMIRIFTYLILISPVLLYSYYISESNYNGEYRLSIMLFSITGLFYSLNNWISLVLKAFNRYITSFLIINLSNIITKLLGVWMFIRFGFDYFILVLTFLPVIVFIVSIGSVTRYLKIIKPEFKRIKFGKQYLSFAGIGYLKYALSKGDRLIITLLVQPEVQATYGLAKQIEEIGKTFIEGFFDPIIQKIVRFKNTPDKFREYDKYVSRIHKVILTLSIFILIILVVNINYIIDHLNFNEYLYIDIYIILAMFSSFLYLSYKVKGNIVSLIEIPTKLIVIDVSAWLIGFLALLLTSYIELDQYLFINRVFSEIILLIMFYYFWIKNSNRYLSVNNL